MRSITRVFAKSGVYLSRHQAGRMPGPASVRRKLVASGQFVRVSSWTYGLTPDGSVLVVMGGPERSVNRLEIVTNFTAEVGRLAPAARR